MKEKCEKPIAQAPIGVFIAKYCTLVEIRKENRTLIHTDQFKETKHALKGIERVSLDLTPKEEREADYKDRELEELLQIMARKSREHGIAPNNEDEKVNEIPENDDARKHFVKKIISVLSKYDFVFFAFD